MTSNTGDYWAEEVKINKNFLDHHEVIIYNCYILASSGRPLPQQFKVSKIVSNYLGISARAPDNMNSVIFDIVFLFLTETYCMTPY